MTLETIRFGNQIYGYLLLILVLGTGLFLTGIVCRWFYTLFIPSKRILKRQSRILLLLLIFGPILIVGGAIWAVYRIGYCHFYSLRIEQEQELVVCYLWPKGEVKIPTTDIASIAVIREGAGWQASDVLVIKTKSGTEFLSTAPVPEPKALPNKIKQAVGSITGENKK